MVYSTSFAEYKCQSNTVYIYVGFVRQVQVPLPSCCYGKIVCFFSCSKRCWKVLTSYTNIAVKRLVVSLWSSEYEVICSVKQVFYL